MLFLFFIALSVVLTLGVWYLLNEPQRSLSFRPPYQSPQRVRTRSQANLRPPVVSVSRVTPIATPGVPAQSGGKVSARRSQRTRFAKQPMRTRSYLEIR